MADVITRKWVPAFLVDEVTPTPRAHPDHWLIAEVVTAPGWWVTDPDDEHSASARMDVGETMEFEWFVDHGEIIFTIAPDGTYTTDRPIPAEATHFWVRCDGDTIALSPDQFARQIADNFIGLDEIPGEVEANIYQWSEQPVTFRLALVDGKPHFEEVTGDG